MRNIFEADVKKTESLEPGYTLVIAEKPDASRKIASALGIPKGIRFGKVEVLDVGDSFNGEHYVVCAAAGHLYGVGDLHSKRSTYPVFDVEWLPLDAIHSSKRRSVGSGQKYSFVKRKLEVIRTLSGNAKKFVHACDYDLEGETIGFNILKFACEQSTLENCKRAKFSTLTESEVRDSFSHLHPLNESLARAGRTRHIVDFFWGINLSRALSEAYLRSGRGYRNVTTGRVQGPTLAFAVEREFQIKAHVPLPFWRVSASLNKDGTAFDSHYEKQKIDTKHFAEAVIENIRSEKNAIVKTLRESTIRLEPPFPFNLGDLQTESFRRYGSSPSSTLKVAERLYLKALISYPRTNSQKLPESLGYRRLISAILSMPEYREFEGVLRRHYPRQGVKEDAAHPAIYPTGEPPRRLDASERKIYDLVVRRFLSTFGEDAVISETTAHFDIAGHDFKATGRRLVKSGWMKINPLNRSNSEIQLPPMRESDILRVTSTRLHSEFSRGPERFSQSSLLRAMETEDLGTKATRSEVIATLIKRGYMNQTASGNLEASEIGMQLVQTMKRHCEEIVSVGLTRRIEAEIESISGGEDGTRTLQRAREAVSSAVEKIRMSEIEVGAELAEAGFRSREEALRIGKCPECSNGYLRIVKSPRTGKRFIGCSDYQKGCRTSAPLPQKGMIRALGRQCPTCRWPIVHVFFRGRRTSWKQCPNLSCNSRKSK